MKTKTDKTKGCKYIEVISFLLSSLLGVLIFASQGIFPGGRSMIITYDLKAELLALYGYLSNPGPGYDTMFHSMSGGLGGGFFGTAALYLSPFDLIYSFIPVKYLPNAIWFMIVFKIGLCGLFCSAFLKRNVKTSLSGVMCVLLSCCYALMSYNIVYSVSPMWYDAVMLLPLLALLSEKIILGKKSPAFVLIMAFCIISDYYMAYMVAIALILYVLFRLIEDGNSIKDSAKRFCILTYHGLLSAGLSMFVIIPVLYDFKRGKLAEGDIGLTGDFIKNSLVDVLLSFKSQNYPGFDFNASPNIFCGSVVLVLAVVWLILGKKNAKGRLSALAVIVFYFLSFIFGPLDRAWHGLREPVCFSVRYAFTFVFFMICFAARGINALKNLNNESIKKYSGLLCGIAVLYTFIELYMNGSFVVAMINTEMKYTYSDEYYRLCDVVEKLVPYEELDNANSYGRVVAAFKVSDYDGALFGYDGLSQFTSSYNYEVHNFFRSLGLGSYYQNMSSFGITPPVMGLISAKYYLNFYTDASSVYDTVAEYRGYTLYQNNADLPLAFEINPEPDEVTEFTSDPFENINIVYDELFDSNDECLNFFTKVDHVPYPQRVDSPYDFTYFSSNSFTADKTGNYYFAIDYTGVKTEELSGNGIIVRDYYLDGEYVGSFGNDMYNLCIYLGHLNAGETHVLTLESSSSEIGEIYMYRYETDDYRNFVSRVNGFMIDEIGKNGIKVSGTVEEDSEILMTLPYEDGYKIYVDGEITDYSSYRKTMIKLPVSAGNHEIYVKYTIPGLLAGIIVSVISLLIYVFIFIYKKTN